MRVVAVAGEDESPRHAGRLDAGDDRLLADVDVEIAADLPFPELPLGRFLEPADEDHLPEKVGPLGGTDGLVDDGCGGCLVLGHEPFRSVANFALA